MSSPPRSNRTRSAAMTNDLLHDKNTINSNPRVPRWLVQSQRQHAHPQDAQVLPPVKKSGKKKETKDDLPDKKTAGPSTSGVVDDDLIMVDLLDGAHLHTKGSPHQKPATSTMDSVCALPPIDGGALAWEREDKKNWRKMRRGGGSLGGFTTTPSRRPPTDRLNDNHKPPPPTSSFKSPQPAKPHTIVHMGHGRASKGTPLSEGMMRRVEESKRAAERNKPIPEARLPTSIHQKTSPSEDEITPLVGKAARKERAARTQNGSFRIPRDMFMMDDDNVSTGQSGSVVTKAERRRRDGRRAKRRKLRSQERGQFTPSAWGWRKPAEEDAVMPRGAVIYLPLIGFLTFIIAYCVNDTSTWIANQAIRPGAELITSWLEGVMGRDTAYLWSLAGLRGVALVISFVVVLYIAPQYSAGSGIPEMKCVLSGVLMPNMLNWRTLVGKMIGLSFALASSISIGRLGPFIHMSCITAALVAKFSWFSELHSRPRFQLQALNAAMAAGVGATFGAPIGGTMLSIEIMSTYYYIHWLPMALYCSIMGYYFIVSFVEGEENHSYFSTSVRVALEVESLQRLITYVLLGALCGVIGAALVHFTKLAFKFRSAFFTNATPVRTGIMLAAFAIVHTLVTFHVGGIIATDQKSGVEALFNEKSASSAWMKNMWEPFSQPDWNFSVMLFTQMCVKFLLTGFSLVMPVPAGTFMPIFELGALLGRAFGELCKGIEFVDWIDSRATAIIGAAALTSGALHTTSIAVVMLELTREAIDVLPLAVGVLISYMVSKQLCSDLFSELIKLRRLPFILGLRERYPSENKRFYEAVASVVAGSFMSTNFPYVTPLSTKKDVYQLLTRGGKPWINCAFLSDPERRRLWGTISQKALWDALGDDIPIGTPPQSEDESELGYGSLSSIARERRWNATQHETIPFLRNFDPSVGSAEVDMGPMQVSVHTPFWKVITYFRMLSMSTMYVMKDGVTVGCVSKAQVITKSIDIEEKAQIDRRKRIAEKKRMKEVEQEIYGKLLRDLPTSSRMTSRMLESDMRDFARKQGRRSRQGSVHKY